MYDVGEESDFAELGIGLEARANGEVSLLVDEVDRALDWNLPSDPAKRIRLQLKEAALVLAIA